jgi:hypothetical protein
MEQVTMPFNGPTPSTVLQAPEMGGTPAQPVEQVTVPTFTYKGFDFPVPMGDQTGRVPAGALVQVLVSALASDDPRAFLKAAMVEIRDVRGNKFFPL